MTARERLMEAFMSEEVQEAFFHGVWADDYQPDREAVMGRLVDTLFHERIWSPMQCELAGMYRKRKGLPI